MVDIFHKLYFFYLSKETLKISNFKNIKLNETIDIKLDYSDEYAKLVEELNAFIKRASSVLDMSSFIQETIDVSKKSEQFAKKIDLLARDSEELSKEILNSLNIAEEESEKNISFSQKLQSEIQSSADLIKETQKNIEKLYSILSEVDQYLVALTALFKCAYKRS